MEALEIFERLGTLLEPARVRKELEELPETLCARVLMPAQAMEGRRTSHHRDPG